MVDILIIGGGPAGCAAAIRARQLGFTSLIIESSQLPRGGPGETFHPGMESIFRRLELLPAIQAEDFHRHRGIWVQWESDRQFHAYGADSSGDWLGWQIPRAQFQAVARAAVERAGCAMVFANPVGLLVNEGRIEGVQTTEGTFRSRYVLDATGRRRWLAAGLGIPVSAQGPRLVAKFGWERENPHEGDPELRVTEDGWHWHAPLGRAGAAWVRLHVAPEENPVSGLDVTWRMAKTPAQANWYLLGDAAAELDPASSHGVLRAMMSGMLAVRAIAAHCTGACTEAAAAGQYADWLRATIHHDASELTSLYARHPFRRVSEHFKDVPSIGE